jgi:hypothetical protein
MKDFCRNTGCNVSTNALRNPDDIASLLELTCLLMYFGRGSRSDAEDTRVEVENDRRAEVQQSRSAYLHHHSFPARGPPNYLCRPDEQWRRVKQSYCDHRREQCNGHSCEVVTVPDFFCSRRGGNECLKSTPPAARCRQTPATIFSKSNSQLLSLTPHSAFLSFSLSCLCPWAS